MVQLILLAAGLSRRFGENKLLVPWQGQPLYQHSLTALWELTRRRADCRLLVVTRWPPVARQARGLGLRVCWNDHSEEGISSSLRLGLEAAPEADYYLCSVADQPQLTAALLDEFLAGFLASGQPLGCVRHDGVPGNPAVFHRRFRPELLALTGDTGGRQVLRRHAEDCYFWDGPALRDVDRPEDFSALSPAP